MEKIIQLSEEDYSDLIERAERNDEQIQQAAEEIWKEKGSYSLSVELKFDKSNYLVGDTLTFKPYTYVRDWGKQRPFPLSEDQKLAAVKFVNERLDRFMRARFGRQITDINYIRSLRKNEEERTSKTRSLVIAGGLMSLTVLVIKVLEIIFH